MQYYSKLERIAKNYLIKPIKIAALATSLYLTNSIYSADICVPKDYPKIQEAIVVASNGDRIIVSPGIYKESITFRGKAIRLESSDGPEKTIIDGTGLDTSVVKCIDAEGSDTVLNGFTITGGDGSKFEDIIGGGGMINADSKATISNCKFIENSLVKSEFPYKFGGGILNIRSNPTIVDCTFLLNYAFTGGGIANYKSNPIIKNCIIKSNIATNDAGGIWNNDSTSFIKNCIFSNNISTDNGGGMYNNANSNLLNCVFFENKTRRGGYQFHGTGGLATMTNCIIWNNDNSMCCNEFIIYNYCNIQGAGPNQPGTGNINADPLFIDPNFGDFHLQPNSPCIDAGDPNSPLDPDGTRVDMGALFYNQGPPLPPQFIRGDANMDKEFDVSDPVYTLLYEFAVIPRAKCLDALDADDNGRINITDPIYMLNSIFLAGPNPPAPFPEAGTDPTSDLDNLTCD